MFLTNVYVVDSALSRRTLYSIWSSLRRLLKLSFLSPMEPFDQVSDRLVWLFQCASASCNFVAPAARNSKDDLVVSSSVWETRETSAQFDMAAKWRRAVPELDN